MTSGSYQTLIRIIAFLLGAIIALATVMELPVWVPFIAIMLALVIADIARRSVTAITTDERNNHIFEKATTLSYRIYTWTIAVIAIVTMVNRSVFPDWVWIAGQTLAYSLCAFMLLHLALTRHYEKRL
jgi:uncharacterized membrane protein